MGNLLKPDEVDIVMMNETHGLTESCEDGYPCDADYMSDEECEAAMAELEAEFGDDLDDIEIEEDPDTDLLDQDINDEIETEEELLMLGDGDGELVDLADQGYVE